MSGSKYQPVFVIWEDPATVDAWTSPGEVAVEVSNTIHSAGLLISDDGVYLRLSMNHDTDAESLSCSAIIPRCLVKAIIPLRT